MSCNCIDEMDALLAERNTKLSPTFIFTNPVRSVVTIETEVVAKKRGARPVAMLPTFCPFCGTKYEDA